jgi:hypothetical protein
MSVQQEHLKMKQSTASDKNDSHDSHADTPPKLEFASSSESLEAFGAALGGAILGVLATLLILAVINNGTLRFTDAGGTEALALTVTRIDENLGAVNHNVEVVAQRLQAMEGEGGAITQLQGSLSQLDSSLATLDQQLAQQGVRLDEMDVTRRNFDTFTAALAQALAAMDDVGAPAAAQTTAVEEAPAAVAPAEDAAPAVVEPTEAVAPAEAAEVDVMQPFVTADASVPANAIQAYLFMDANADGVMDADEASLMGATIVLTAPDGETFTAQSADSGVLFEGLEAGEYTITVDDALGFELASEVSAVVTVTEDGEGQSVFFPVTMSE